MGKTNFIDGDKSQGILGTRILAAWLNKVFNHRHDGLDQDGSAPIDYSADTGVANAYAIALTPALTANITGLPIVFKATNSNTGASTLAVNGLAAVAIKKNVNQTLVAGDIAAGQIVEVIFDGANFQMVNNGQSVDLGQFTKYVAATGWMKRPDGMIEQWGSATTLADGSVAVTFPTAFPTAVLSVTLGLTSGLPVTGLIGYTGVTTTGMSLSASNVSGAPIAATITWKAVGN